MPFDRFVLILVCVFTAAVVTVYGGLAIVGSTQLPPYFGVSLLSIIALGAYVCLRVVAQRGDNKDDDCHDGFEK